jgi:superfamily I DNA and/or RNA helicase
MAIQIYREGTILNARDTERLQQGEDVKVRRGSILIVTPYVCQKNEINFLLSQATAAELLLGLVEARTADSSLSHSASVVIVDIVRTSRRDFTGNPDCYA